MVLLTMQQQLVGLLASAVCLPALPLARQHFYHQMLELLTEEPFPEPDAETVAAMEGLMAQVKAELQWE